jgi:hypothetical protein
VFKDFSEIPLTRALKGGTVLFAAPKGNTNRTTALDAGSRIWGRFGAFDAALTAFVVDGWPGS